MQDCRFIWAMPSYLIIIIKNIYICHQCSDEDIKLAIPTMNIYPFKEKDDVLIEKEILGVQKSSEI